MRSANCQRILRRPSGEQATRRRVLSSLGWLCHRPVRPDTRTGCRRQGLSRALVKAIPERDSGGQLHLARRGFPCATPLLSARPLTSERPNLAVAETWLPDPGSVRQLTLEQGLFPLQAWLAKSTGATIFPTAGLEDHPLRRPAKGLYPEPFSQPDLRFRRHCRVGRVDGSFRLPKATDSGTGPGATVGRSHRFVCPRCPTE